MIATKSWSIQNYRWPSTIHRRRHGTIILGHKQLKQCNWKLFLRLFQELTMYRWSGERDLSAIVHLKLLARMFFPLSTHYQIRLPYHITDKHEKLRHMNRCHFAMNISVSNSSKHLECNHKRWTISENCETYARLSILSTGHRQSTDKYWSRTWEQSAGQIKDLNFHTGASRITNTHSVGLVGIHVGRAYAMTHPWMVFFSPS